MPRAAKTPLMPVAVSPARAAEILSVRPDEVRAAEFKFLDNLGILESVDNEPSKIPNFVRSIGDAVYRGPQQCC